MKICQPEDTIHKAWLYRLLLAIQDDLFLAKFLRFKGGTCCSMLGILDRFSVDLDFDLIDLEDLAKVRRKLEKIFSDLGLEIKDKSNVAPQYFLKYDNLKSKRSILKIDISFPAPQSNKYEAIYFSELDRVINCQSIDTMFANKLVALMDRYQKNESIAGRDLFDIHSFFLQGLSINVEVIKERRGQNKEQFFISLASFINEMVTQKIIDEDLNSLVPTLQFKKIRKNLKREVLIFLRT